jgi:hypothetical protein
VLGVVDEAEVLGLGPSASRVMSTLATVPKGEKILELVVSTRSREPSFTYRLSSRFTRSWRCTKGPTCTSRSSIKLPLNLRWHPERPRPSRSAHSRNPLEAPVSSPLCRTDVTEHGECVDPLLSTVGQGSYKDIRHRLVGGWSLPDHILQGLP